MNYDHKWLKSILVFTVLLLLASCVTAPSNYVPNDSAVGNVSVEEARNTLATELKGIEVCYDHLCTDKINEVRVTPGKLTVTYQSGGHGSFKFKKLPEIILIDYGSESYIELTTQPVVGIRRLGRGMHDVANALYVLKQNSINPKSDIEYDARFTALLSDYRNKAASNTALPEEANRYKVQAEGAVRDKQFDVAADFYAEALKISPWWPVGHFNRALILGETGDYEMAIREIKRYLQLVPDAPNARAAQDKIYDWERLDSK